MRVLGWIVALLAVVALVMALIDAVPNPAALVVWALVLALIAVSFLELANARRDRRDAERWQRARGPRS